MECTEDHRKRISVYTACCGKCASHSACDKKGSLSQICLTSFCCWKTALKLGDFSSDLCWVLEFSNCRDSFGV
jgi:hypothetical protein